MKVASTCLHWSSPVLRHSSQTLASAISYPSFNQLSLTKPDRSNRFNAQPTRLHRSRSCDFPLSSSTKLNFTCTATFNNSSSSSDEDFSSKIEDLSLSFQLSDDNNSNSVTDSDSSESIEPFIPSIIERKANSVEIPFSLRIISKKLQWKEGFRDAGESACCSVKKAFSSMVFIIRELQSYTLQMREILFYEDLQGILSRVHREMHASFVWLFQQVFSHTPTLMVYVMILLANFTVFSMGNNAAIAAAVQSPPLTEVSSATETYHSNKKFDSSYVKTFSISSSSGKTASIGGSNGGGGKFRPVASGTDGGDGGFNGGLNCAALELSGVGTAGETEAKEKVEEESLWEKIVEEARGMEVSDRGGDLDEETVKRLVSPVTVRIESDEDYAEYLRTELLYQTALFQEPNNALLLANYAQFLYLVAHDYDRFVLH